MLGAGVTTEAHPKNKLERVAGYITRPPVAIERLSLTPQGHIKYSLKTPYRDGSTLISTGLAMSRVSPIAVIGLDRLREVRRLT
jgi:hypothetical protein